MLVIIIGLPGSGKTYLAQTEFTNYTIFDDFLSQFYNGQVIQALQQRKNVCLTDPRLCNPITFNRIMGQILQHTTKDNIRLILFENRPDLCAINKPERAKSAYKMSTHYSIDNYKDWDFIQYPISNQPS